MEPGRMAGCPGRGWRGTPGLCTGRGGPRAWDRCPRGPHAVTGAPTATPGPLGCTLTSSGRETRIPVPVPPKAGVRAQHCPVSLANGEERTHGASGSATAPGPVTHLCDIGWAPRVLLKMGTDRMTPVGRGTSWSPNTEQKAEAPSSAMMVMPLRKAPSLCSWGN